MPTLQESFIVHTEPNLDGSPHVSHTDRQTFSNLNDSQEKKNSNPKKTKLKNLTKSKSYDATRCKYGEVRVGVEEPCGLRQCSPNF